MLYVAYSQRLGKLGGLLYIAISHFAMPTRSGEIIKN